MPWPMIKPTMLALSAALLAGCATNTGRLDRGETLVSSGTTATVATAVFFGRVRAAREDANVALVASSPTCPWAEQIVVRSDDPPSRQPHAARNDGLLNCRARGEAVNTAAGDQVVSLLPVSEQALRPTIDTIEALVAYLDAVNTVMAAGTPDATKLDDALGYASKAQAGLNTVLKSKLAVIPTLTDDQQAAITGLFKLINDLAAEQHKARQLENLVARQNIEVGGLIRSLDQQVRKWGQASLEGDTQLADASLIAVGRRLGEGQPADPASRATLIRMMIEAKRTTEAAPIVIAAVHAALGDMASAQDALVAAYTANPGWTKDERAKQAKLNRRRLIGALKAVAAAAGTFIP